MSENALAVDRVLDETNAHLQRLRHPRDAAGDLHPAARASLHATDYIRAFWPHVAAAISTDPLHLGLSVERADGAVVCADDLARAFASETRGDEAVVARMAAMLSSLALMSQVLNGAATRWMRDFEGPAPRCPLAFSVAAGEYVSLRMLLDRRGAGERRIDANAPVLVMGGTATALGMCWNLLGCAPGAFQESAGRAPTRAEIERIWDDTRELIFRIGAGSLAAFVAFASACSSTSGALLWDGTGDLGLAQRDGGYTWTMTPALVNRYRELLDEVIADQHGHYVGCAALYTRAPALPLAAQWADPVEAQREPNVFAELLRWLTAVARRQYFPLFAAGA